MLARLDAPLTLERARRMVNDWKALPYKDLAWDQLWTLIYIDTGSFESPLTVLAQSPGGQVWLLTPDEMRALFRTSKPTRADLVPYLDPVRDELSSLLPDRGVARGIPLYNEAGTPLEYFVFGYTYD